MRKKVLVSALAAALFLSGCAKVTKHAEPVEKQSYQLVENQTTEVQRGDIDPVIDIGIRQDGLTVKTYPVTGDNLTIKAVNVKVGQKVCKGDVLVEFYSEEITYDVKQYTNRIEENKLLKEHYQKLGSINKDSDYSHAIRVLDRDTEVSQLYLDELTAKLDFYKIVAEEDGTVNYLDSYIAGGYYQPTNRVLSVAYGTGKYAATVNDEYDYKIGETYIATYGMIEYEFKLVETKMEYLEGLPLQTLIFEPISNISTLQDNESLVMSIEKETIYDAVYVDRAAVKNDKDGFGDYVLIEGDNGYFRRHSITKGDTVGDYTIITSGLSGGEKVVVR